MTNMAEPTKNKSVKKPQESVTTSFFAQLRHLGKEVDDALTRIPAQLRLEPGQRREELIANRGKNLAALGKIWKDMKSTKESTKQLVTDCERKGASVTQIQNLFREVMKSQASRLENVESFIEKYGYKRLQLTVSPNEAEGGSFENDKCSEESSTTTSEAADVSNDEPNNARCSEEPVQAACVLKAPRIEDLHKNLSDESLRLLKQRRNFRNLGSELEGDNTCNTDRPSENNNVNPVPPADSKVDPVEYLKSMGRPIPPKLSTGTSYFSSSVSDSDTTQHLMSDKMFSTLPPVAPKLHHDSTLLQLSCSKSNVSHDDIEDRRNLAPKQLFSLPMPPKLHPETTLLIQSVSKHH